MKLKKVLSAVFILCFSIPAQAESGGYFSGSFGISIAQEDGFDNDQGFKVGGGYKFNNNVSIEGAYVDLGELEADSDIVSSLEFLAGVSIDDAYVEITGLEANLLISTPVSNAASVFAKLGVFTWDASFKIDLTTFGTETVDDDGNDLFFGAGFLFDVSKEVGIRAEYTRYDAFDGDTDFLSVGVDVSF